MLERLRLIGLETGSECQTDTGRVMLVLTRTNLPEHCAELKCLNTEKGKTLLAVFELKLDFDVNAAS